MKYVTVSEARQQGYPEYQGLLLEKPQFREKDLSNHPGLGAHLQMSHRKCNSIMKNLFKFITNA